MTVHIPHWHQWIVHIPAIPVFDGLSYRGSIVAVYGQQNGREHEGSNLECESPYGVVSSIYD